MDILRDFPETPIELSRELPFAIVHLNWAMASGNFEQYEIWVDNHGKWERIALFRDLTAASAVFSNRNYRQKLLHVTYDENGKKVSQETVAEIGRTRQEEPPPVEMPAPASPSRKRKAS